MVMVLDRFFLRDLLSARTIIRYTLRRLVDDFDRVYLWEILFNALSGLDSRASQVGVWELSPDPVLVFLNHVRFHGLGRAVSQGSTTPLGNGARQRSRS